MLRCNNRSFYQIILDKRGIEYPPLQEGEELHLDYNAKLSKIHDEYCRIRKAIDIQEAVLTLNRIEYTDKKENETHKEYYERLVRHEHVQIITRVIMALLTKLLLNDKKDIPKHVEYGTDGLKELEELLGDNDTYNRFKVEYNRVVKIKKLEKLISEKEKLEKKIDKEVNFFIDGSPFQDMVSRMREEYS